MLGRGHTALELFENRRASSVERARARRGRPAAASRFWRCRHSRTCHVKRGRYRGRRTAAAVGGRKRTDASIAAEVAERDDGALSRADVGSESGSSASSWLTVDAIASSSTGGGSGVLARLFARGPGDASSCCAWRTSLSSPAVSIFASAVEHSPLSETPCGRVSRAAIPSPLSLSAALVAWRSRRTTKLRTAAISCERRGRVVRLAGSWAQYLVRAAACLLTGLSM